MKPEVYFDKGNQMNIDKTIFQKWMVKVPTTQHIRKGTCSMTPPELEFDIPKKQGIFLINPGKRKYIKIPRDLINGHTTLKDCSGMVRSLVVINVKEIIEQHGLVWEDIVIES